MPRSQHPTTAAVSPRPSSVPEISSAIHNPCSSHSSGSCLISPAPAEHIACDSRVISRQSSHTLCNASTMPSCTYCIWLDTWPDIPLSSRPASPSESSGSSRRLPSILQHDDTRRHGMILNESSLSLGFSMDESSDDYLVDYSGEWPGYDDLVAWRGPPPPYEEDEVPTHLLAHLQARSEMYGRKRSRCSSLTEQMANLVRVDSVVSVTEAVVKGVGEVGKKAMDLPRAVGGFKKALEAKRAKKKLTWLGKKKYL